MKILLSTYYNVNFTAVNDHVESTLRRMGHDVEAFEHYRYRLPGRLRDRFPRLERWDVDRLNRALLDRADALRPDLLLVLAGITLRPETIAAIRRRGIVAANWFADYPVHFDYTMAVAPAYDHFFVSDSMSGDRHRAAGHRNVHWLPFGCLPEWADECGEEETSTATLTTDDVVFVGSWYPEREQFLQQLSALIPGCRLAIWGPGWREQAGRGALYDTIRGGALQPDDWRRLYRNVPFALNLHYGFGGDPVAYGAMANTKVYEVLATGGFLMSDEKKDLTALFRSGREFVGFHDAADCAAKIRYYLGHPGERRAIAAQGQRETLAHHTYEHRLCQLLATVEARG
jgi:spore maturation protein CgeB